MVPVIIVQRLPSFLLTPGETNIFRGVFRFIFSGGFFFFQRIPMYTANTCGNSFSENTQIYYLNQRNLLLDSPVIPLHGHHLMPMLLCQTYARFLWPLSCHNTFVLLTSELCRNFRILQAVFSVFLKSTWQLYLFDSNN